jgi:hypothetical protein
MLDNNGITLERWRHWNPFRLKKRQKSPFVFDSILLLFRQQLKKRYQPTIQLPKCEPVIRTQQMLSKHITDGCVELEGAMDCANQCTGWVDDKHAEVGKEFVDAEAGEWDACAWDCYIAKVL